MNGEQYRAEMDAVSFSPDFQARTVARLTELAREKEKKTMKKFNVRTVLVAAVVAAALTVTAFAAVVMLKPQDVAQRAGNPALADIFEKGGDQVYPVHFDFQTVGDYKVTLMGLATSEALSQVEDLDASATYAVLAYARTDGTPITDDIPELTVSPLVEGYAPWRVNAWTLNGSAHTFAQDGVLYCLLECDGVEPFADRTVYLAVYPGTNMPPSAGEFDFDEATGAISVKDGADVALFTLPLDPAKADAAKAQSILEGMPW